MMRSTSGTARASSPQHERHDGIADLDHSWRHDTTADFADDDVVFRSVQEEWTEGAAFPRVAADARRELGRVVGSDAYVPRDLVGAKRLTAEALMCRRTMAMAGISTTGATRSSSCPEAVYSVAPAARRLVSSGASFAPGTTV
jgi:hypothetical protein